MTAATRSPRDGLSIGAVLAQLRPDFPDVTISKIRFLESEGLVSPARTASGYRQFTEADVARLRFVLTAQRDHYLPLKVIRAQLAAADVRQSRPLVAVPNAVDTADPQARPTREELIGEAGVDAGLLAELEQYGLFGPDSDGRYDADAVLIAATVRALTDFGIEPRHLRAFRAAADREVGLLSQIVAPLYRNRDPQAHTRADEMCRELARLSGTLHTALVKAALRAATGG